MASYEDPFGADENERFILYPIKHQDLWDFKTKAQNSLWLAREIDLSKDYNQFIKLPPTEQQVVKRILAFFSASDGIVNENLVMRFYGDVNIPEARAFYAFQSFIEAVHQETYSDQINIYVPDLEERHRLFHAIRLDPIISEKAAWAVKWKSETAPFSQRLFAMACVEGIHFSSSFGTINWFKKENKLPGLTQANDFIQRDETSHWLFAALLYFKIKPHLRFSDNFLTILREAVELEHRFVDSLIPEPMMGLNRPLMKQYVCCVADMIMEAFGLQAVYKVPNPFDFMDMVTVSKNSYVNFFEQRGTEYQRHLIKEFEMSSDF
jgi:ribonucleotide reductase beta subunit family protein with ferritin-like domain